MVMDQQWPLTEEERSPVLSGLAYLCDPEDLIPDVAQLELAPLLESLRAKVYCPTLPGSVTLFIDACFSGTVTRGEYELPARGAPVPLGPPASNTRGGGGSDQGSGAGELVAGRNESRIIFQCLLV